MIPDAIGCIAGPLLPPRSPPLGASKRMPSRLISFIFIECDFGWSHSPTKQRTYCPTLKFFLVFPHYRILALPFVSVVVRAGVVGVDCDLYGSAVGFVGLPSGVFEEASDGWYGDGDEDADDGDDDDEFDEGDAGFGGRFVGLACCAGYSNFGAHGYTSSVWTRMVGRIRVSPYRYLEVARLTVESILPFPRSSAPSP